MFTSSQVHQLSMLIQTTKLSNSQVYNSSSIPITNHHNHRAIMTHVKLCNAPRHDFYMHVVPNYDQGRHLETSPLDTNLYHNHRL